MSTLTITVPGKPMGKQRPRASKRGGFVRLYTPEQTVNAETFTKLCAMDQVGQPMLEGPLVVAMHAVFDIPVSFSKKKKADALSGALRPTGKPDLDNLAKLYSDALNKIVWGDDAQIVSMALSKSYGIEPGVTITINPLVSA
jgi:Holliday junction resolvase RusA-like endonuclease